MIVAEWCTTLGVTPYNSEMGFPFTKWTQKVVVNMTMFFLVLQPRSAWHRSKHNYKIHCYYYCCWMDFCPIYATNPLNERKCFCKWHLQKFNLQNIFCGFLCPYLSFLNALSHQWEVCVWRKQHALIQFAVQLSLSFVPLPFFQHFCFIPL